MSGFCGWAGSGLGHTASQQALEAMVRELGNTPGTQSQSVLRETAAAAARDGDGLYPVSLHEEDGILSLLFGTPHWTDSSLAEIAERFNPAAALTTAYRRMGRDFLPRLHGPFSLAILDGESALLAIDRMGIHTLSCAQRQDTLIFSTQIRSTSAHPLVKREIDPQAIYNYFYFHHIPSPGSIYRDIEKLMPAQYLSFQNGRTEKGFYWSLPFSDQDSTPYDTHARRFRQLLDESVTSTSHGGRLGAFLSGGTDSSTICGVLSEHRNDAVESYSIGYSAEEFDEMVYARIAVEQFHCNPHEYYLEPDDVMTAIPVITGYYDEPFGNDSAVPVYVCAKRAANDGIAVMLAGDGGDEVFGGNVRYAKQKIFEIYARVPAALRKGMIEPLLLHIPGGERLPLLRKAMSYIKQANIPLPERMESYNFLYRQSLEDVFEPGFLEKIDPSMPDALLREVYFRTASTDPINRMMHLDLKFTLADNDLRKVSGMCEAAGVEVRYPLLDERLVEFSGELPPDYKVKGQQLRWFFKQALHDLLPREIIDKSKHGFGLPFGEWSLSHPPLRELVNDSLEQFSERGILRRSYILELQRQHKEIHPTYFGKMVWVILMLEQWLQTHHS
jgi:asparagine synthase (glutamine-hydrolysing)